MTVNEKQELTCGAGVACPEHPGVLSLPLIWGRISGIKDQELITPLKAGFAECLSLVL